MTSGNEWEKFFDGHAPIYMDNVFTKNTLAEVDFLLDELRLPPGSRILDVGCGTGRHSVELAKRGFKMTGVDISSQMLAEGKKAAKQASVKIEWIQSDATRFTVKGQFDAALCLCEGAFGLLGTGDDPLEHDLSILRNIHSVLKSEARLIITVLNGCHMLRKFQPEDVKAGKFDPTTLSESSEIEIDSPNGRISVHLTERGYVPTELALLLRLAGFRVEHIWGGTAGSWGRRPLDLDEMEIMAVARKSSAARER
ncbi:MAG: cyclopropane-fatty-acyl-phospholipid synthase [Chloroflexi bacterium RBG_16_51_9]|nr:MAG: cyclopropane-fatty-acyl-phospholipid synthase [Chloroflexi bacterium RBG_16_51_9]